MQLALTSRLLHRLQFTQTAWCDANMSEEQIMVRWKKCASSVMQFYVLLADAGKKKTKKTNKPQLFCAFEGLIFAIPVGHR